MINPSFQDLDQIAESRYEICVMCMKRARLLVDHSKPLVKSRAQKPVTQALEEVMAGKIQSCSPGEARLLMEEERKRKAEKKKEEPAPEGNQEGDKEGEEPDKEQDQ